MINKRLLIKNLLAHNDENSFYDKKRKIDISNKEGKAKFLKHVCALSNSNPKNNSFIVIGVEDDTNEIVGAPFFDDSKIQNLINAYFTNPPLVSYENIPFPHLPQHLVVGLVTIKPTDKLTALRKNIWKYWGGSVFFRDGSISMPKVFDIVIKDVNSATVAAIENHARNSIELTLAGVLDFINHRHKDLYTDYKVFKEQFVVCWAGHVKKVKDKTFYSRVDIELINEQVRLFYSALDEVAINVNEDSFTILEYVLLGLQDTFKYYPLEELTITFKENGFYGIDSKLVFEPPEYDKKLLYHIYNNNNAILQKIQKREPLNKGELHDLNNLASTYLICYLNGFEQAMDKLEAARPFLRNFGNKIYGSYKENIRILRKVKYN